MTENPQTPDLTITHPRMASRLKEIFYSSASCELLSNLVFEGCWSCGDLGGFGGFDAVFECDAGDDFGEVVKAA